MAYAAALAFHVALLSFGWGFSIWSLPMLAALARLLRAERAAAGDGARARAAPGGAVPEPA